jgi:hypothetical protein
VVELVDTQDLKSCSPKKRVRVRFPLGAQIFICMACHCLTLKNSREFYALLKGRDPDIILKMVKCVLSAYKRDKEYIDIFDITFKNLDGLIFTIDKSQYTELLGNCLNDLIAIEEYELCAEIKKITDKKSTKKYGDALAFDS